MHATRDLAGIRLTTSGMILGEEVFLALAMFNAHGCLVTRDEERTFILTSGVFVCGSDWAPRRWSLHIANGYPHPKSEVVKLAEHQAAWALTKAMRVVISESNTKAHATYAIGLPKGPDLDRA